jgi:CspA family cold shock protein
MKFIGKFIFCLLVAALASSLYANYQTGDFNLFSPLQFQPTGFVAFAAACCLAVILSNLNIRLPRSNPFSSVREQGAVKWFNVNKGFGFITRDEGGDIFVHFRSIQGKGRRSLREGERVEFKVVDSDKGLQAENVSELND